MILKARRLGDIICDNTDISSMRNNVFRLDSTSFSCNNNVKLNLDLYLSTRSVDCIWGSWSTWVTCSVTCGGGTTERRRTIVQAAQYGGTDCVGNNIDYQSCNTNPCSIDCIWSSWSSWGSCSRTCGGGTQERRRTITQTAQYGGTECTGNSIAYKNCNTNSCPRPACTSCTCTNWYRETCNCYPQGCTDYNGLCSDRCYSVCRYDYYNYYDYNDYYNSYDYYDYYNYCLEW